MRVVKFLLCLATHASAISSLQEGREDFTWLLPRDQAFVSSELGPQLSKGGAVYLPNDPEFGALTDRWQRYRDPNISVVVEVATENDVQKTVLFANKYGLPFLAVNRGHGAINSLGNMYNGIQISLGLLNNITINPSGTTAKMGGGVYNYELINTLFAQNKQAASGACSCTGVVGAGLGGGHGFLQGKYGLILDNIINARVVLANGSVATVSKTSQPDLFWGIQGAGHNFGIVTEFTYRIFDIIPGSTWAYETFIFSHDQVEAVFTAINKMTGVGMQPPELMHYAVILRIPEVDPVNPVILFSILYDGPASAALSYGLPFHAISPLSAQAGSVPYPLLANITFNDLDSSTCAHGLSRLKFPVGVETYNIPQQRKAFDYFANATASQPFLNASALLFEGYSLEAVKAVPDASTAFPHRTDNILISPEVVYEPNVAHDSAAVTFGSTFRAIFESGGANQPLHAYVNYAHGDESLGAMYGYDEWRLTRLKGLKKTYDPLNRFRWYAPLV